jgi:hypothetical protein
MAFPRPSGRTDQPAARRSPRLETPVSSGLPVPSLAGSAFGRRTRADSGSSCSPFSAQCRPKFGYHLPGDRQEQESYSSSPTAGRCIAQRHRSGLPELARRRKQKRGSECASGRNSGRCSPATQTGNKSLNHQTKSGSISRLRSYCRPSFPNPFLRPPDLASGDRVRTNGRAFESGTQR